MNFNIFRYYVFTCKVIGVNPSFKGLAKFKKFYMWERNNYGRY
ncbi:hypothetical protein CBU02nite_22700 [Clostridium butyricum]|uniref:Uncharacterized protein n=1 Tax=Clostridium butyricum TaxID=1492 RepID=A0A512TNC9_CLOBU|nr:hypothetical protein CBU02nite_22700 [Clostridium butyricum]